ncbi:zinc dependent phospholipase C family protein [Patescibacteria group bacterium]
MKKTKFTLVASILLLLFIVTVINPGGFFVNKAQAWYGGNHRNTAPKISTILKNDGYTNYAKTLDSYMSHFKIGSTKPDSWSTTTKSKTWNIFGYTINQTSAEHFYDPSSGRGLPGFRSATQKSNEYFNTAVTRWKAGKKEEAIQWLGMTAHFIQDTSVPQHATRNLIQVIQGHDKYEKWLTNNAYRYYVSRGGSYNFSTQPSYWVKQNAIQAKNYRKYVDGKSNPKDDYQKTSWVLFPKAQRSTAGMVALFMKKVGVPKQIPTKKAAPELKSTPKEDTKKESTPEQKTTPKVIPKLLREIPKNTRTLVRLFLKNKTGYTEHKSDSQSSVLIEPTDSVDIVRSLVANPQVLKEISEEGGINEADIRALINDTIITLFLSLI